MGVRVTDRDKLTAGGLRGTRLFADWPDADFKHVRDAAELWRYGKDEILAQRGDPPKGIWLVATGSLTSYRDSPSGRYMLMGLLWPGDVTGLMPMLDNNPMPLSHAARAESLVVFVPAAAIKAALRGGGAALESMTRFLCARSRIEYESIYTRVVDSKRCQLAKHLAYLPRRSLFPSEGVPGDPGWIDPAPLDVTQAELAAMLGVARQTINRLMTPLLRDKTLTRDGNAIRVANFKRLLAIIEEDERLPEDWRNEILSWDERLNQR